MVDKRQWRIELAVDTAIIAKRSMRRPFIYSIVLLVERGGLWQAVCTFDNAHNVREHHDHRYVGSERQEPIVTYGPETTAMAEVLLRLGSEWADMVSAWDRTR